MHSTLERRKKCLYRLFQHQSLRPGAWARRRSQWDKTWRWILRATDKWQATHIDQNLASRLSKLKGWFLRIKLQTMLTNCQRQVKRSRQGMQLLQRLQRKGVPLERLSETVKLLKLLQVKAWSTLELIKWSNNILKSSQKIKRREIRNR